MCASQDLSSHIICGPSVLLQDHVTPQRPSAQPSGSDQNSRRTLMCVTPVAIHPTCEKRNRNPATLQCGHCTVPAVSSPAEMLSSAKTSPVTPAPHHKALLMWASLSTPNPKTQLLTLPTITIANPQQNPKAANALLIQGPNEGKAWLTCEVPPQNPRAAGVTLNTAVSSKRPLCLRKPFRQEVYASGLVLGTRTEVSRVHMAATPWGAEEFQFPRLSL